MGTRKRSETGRKKTAGKRKTAQRKQAVTRRKKDGSGRRAAVSPSKKSRTKTVRESSRTRARKGGVPIGPDGIDASRARKSEQYEADLAGETGALGDAMTDRRRAEKGVLHAAKAQGRKKRAERR